MSVDKYRDTARETLTIVIDSTLKEAIGAYQVTIIAAPDDLLPIDTITLDQSFVFNHLRSMPDALRGDSLIHLRNYPLTLRLQNLNYQATILSTFSYSTIHVSLQEKLSNVDISHRMAVSYKISNDQLHFRKRWELIRPHVLVRED